MCIRSILEWLSIMSHHNGKMRLIRTREWQQETWGWWIQWEINCKRTNTWTHTRTHAVAHTCSPSRLRPGRDKNRKRVTDWNFDMALQRQSFLTLVFLPERSNVMLRNISENQSRGKKNVIPHITGITSRLNLFAADFVRWQTSPLSVW